MPTFKLHILSPRDKAFDGLADALVATGEEGEFGVLAQHAPMLAWVKKGVTRVTAGGTSRQFVTGEGFVEVSRGEVNMLVDHAEEAPSLDEAKQMLQKHIWETSIQKQPAKT